jgi:hypothetical protein
MTKRSRFAREQRAAEHVRIREIEDGWRSRLTPEARAAFHEQVSVAWAYRPAPRPDMPPGTAPNPPRPGREPRPPKGQAKRSPWS